MRATKKRKVWQINLHSARLTHEGIRKTMRLCTKCLRRVKDQMAKVEKRTVETMGAVQAAAI